LAGEDDDDDINLAFEKWQAQLRKKHLPDDNPIDHKWTDAVLAADFGSSIALIEALQTLPRTPWALKLLADRRDRRNRRGRRGAPKVPIYETRTAMLDWAAIYVRLRRKRLKAALNEARKMGKRARANELEVMINGLISDAARAFQVRERTLENHIESRNSERLS